MVSREIPNPRRQVRVLAENHLKEKQETVANLDKAMKRMSFKDKRN